MTSDRPEVMKAFNVTLQHLLHRALRPGPYVSTAGIIDESTRAAAKRLAQRARKNDRVSKADLYAICKLLATGEYYTLPVPDEEELDSWTWDSVELLDALWRWCHFEPEVEDQMAMKERGTGPLAGEVQ